MQVSENDGKMIHYVNQTFTLAEKRSTR